ncbi:focadhesin isoform X1 [Vespula maculifrons]|uniref:Focadhesin isoform X1 n=1 Tax=Vespula maculifrons TaxID=7453 RepID=A0ABD2CA68_VESMC
MDVIEYKLTSKNPVLISHAVSRLYEIIKEKYKNGTSKDVTKIPEYKLLISKFESKDKIVTTSICQVLVKLVENEIISVTTALCTLISYVSSTNNYVAITVSMSHLIILDFKLHATEDNYLYTLTMPQFPFITILKEEKNSWRTVLDQMHFIMNYPDEQIKENSIKILRPVFIFILCNPSSALSDGCKEKAWQLLKSSNALELQIEILLWLRTNDVDTCLETYYKIFGFTMVSLSKNDKDICIALLPLLLSVCISFLEHGFDPVVNLDTISTIINKYDNLSGNILLALMSEMIVICPGYYLFNVLQLCELVLNKMSCNITLINVLIASILKWMPYPSVLCAEALAIANALINKAVTEVKWTKEVNNPLSEEIFAKLIHFDPHIQFYTESIDVLNTITESNILLWLKTLSKSPIDLRYKYRLILSGLFLQSEDVILTKAICDILMQITKEVIIFASHMLPLIMHKLSKSRDPDELKYLLLTLPELVIIKENVPIVNRTLQTLFHSEGPLKYFALELYLTMNDRDPRCYRYLSSALMETSQNDKSWYADVTCAKVIKHICEERPECAEELAPLISQILNKCGDTNGSAATALALKSISALCRSSVISIASVWKVLAPKMKKEKRTIVMKTLCEFFGDIPFFLNKNSIAYDTLITDVLEILWSYVIQNNPEISEAALKAIAMYRIEDIPLKMLPDDFQYSTTTSQSDTSASSNTKPVNISPALLNTCWIKMLEKVNKMVLNAAGNVLISFITNEVKNFRSGIYNWPHGEPNNFKYLPERSIIRVVGEHVRRIDGTKPFNENVAIECLRIFAFKYPKPLPNINWNFLHKTSEISHKAKEYSLTIACHHSVISSSARNFVEHYLSMFESDKNIKDLLESKEHEILYSNLEILCEAMQIQKIKPFLDVTLSYAVINLFSDDGTNVILFKNIMHSYARALKNEKINDAIRTLLSTTLSNLLDEIDLTQDYYKPYISAILALPVEYIERMTSPDVWWETPLKKLKNAVIIRAELAINNDIEMPLNCMNELIDLVSALPSVQLYLLQEVQRVQTEVKFKMYTSDWVIDFLNRVQVIIPEISEEDQRILFYCDVFFVSIICFSGMDCIIMDTYSIISSQHVRARLFPKAMAMLADIQYWKDNIIPQVMEWLHLMRTSPLPELYKSAFHNSLISLKHHPHYNKNWFTYLSSI